MLNTNLQKLLARHEGLRLTPYQDTVGKLTIGYGRNLEGKGITESEAEFLMTNDIIEVSEELDRRVPFWNQLDLVRKAALTDMAFNLGIGGLLKFKKMFAALEILDWQEAAREALDSTWATQVGQRSWDIADMIITGHWPKWIK